MHNKDTIVIEEEGPPPRCPKCGIFQCCVGLAHQKSNECQRWSKVLNDRETYDKKHENSRRHNIYSNGTPIKKVSQFQYIGRILDSNNNDWGAIQHALQRARIMGGGEIR
jgi:hypothetical protein